jgi:Phage integrase family
VLALTYGPRRGEVLGLHWSALDWKAGTLGVTHSVRRIKDRDTSSGRRTRLVVGEVKTRKSRRTLALTPEMVAMFRQHRIRQAEAQMAAGARWQDFGLIFPSEIGTPMDPEHFSRSFSRLCQRAGLGHWHPHELRHPGASLMLAQGTPLHVVSEVLGHASIAITKDVYGHLLEGDKRAAADSMRRALFGGSNTSANARGSQHGSHKDQKSPCWNGQGACDLGALGGTRTPSLLIRSFLTLVFPDLRQPARTQPDLLRHPLGPIGELA